uniref:Uncharacterized protein n=1 Tax=Lupinus angustifolius TaxID=3871 RepID=L0P0W0_LUPAN|nr:hypothetical protein [Lupinus angustifolius]
MASSSKTTKQRTSTTQKRQGTTSTESNPLDLARLLDNEGQRKVYSKSFPYAIFITNILQHFSVSTNGETKVHLNLRESQIDVEVIHKIGFTQDPQTCTYKHRTNKLTAAAEPSEPEPPNPPEPQPSEFHDQSSSSTAMPTNQMIMDELFTFRGYITNQMDPLNS